jgi:hypothetical protein
MRVMRASKPVTPLVMSLLVHAATAASLISPDDSRLPEVSARDGEELAVEAIESTPSPVGAPLVTQTAPDEMLPPARQPATSRTETPSPPNSVPSPYGSASPTPEAGTAAWSFSATAPSPMNIDLGAARSGVPLGEAAPNPAESSRPGSTPAVREQLATQDAELGIGPAGAVATALRRATVQNVPSDGAAVLRVVFDAAGRVVAIRLLHATGPSAAWARVIEAAMKDTSPSPSLAGAAVDVRVDVTVEHGKPEAHPVEIHGETWAMASSDDLRDVRRVALRVLRIVRGDPAR